MKVKEHVVLSDCISDGLIIGWRRAFKHVDNVPTDTDLIDNIIDNILTRISEYFNFNDMRVQEYTILSNAVELGVTHGISKIKTEFSDIFKESELKNKIAKTILVNMIYKKISCTFSIK